MMPLNAADRAVEREGEALVEREFAPLLRGLRDSRADHQELVERWSARADRNEVIGVCARLRNAPRASSSELASAALTRPAALDLGETSGCVHERRESRAGY